MKKIQSNEGFAKVNGQKENRCVKVDKFYSTHTWVRQIERKANITNKETYGFSATIFPRLLSQGICYHHRNEKASIRIFDKTVKYQAFIV